MPSSKGSPGAKPRAQGGRSFALELKKPGGRTTEAQLEFLEDMERPGAFTAVADDLDHALATLEAWGLLWGTAS